MPNGKQSGTKPDGQGPARSSTDSFGIMKYRTLKLMKKEFDIEAQMQ
jgi:hypothetical protein